MADTFVEPGRFALFIFTTMNGRETNRERYGNYYTVEEAREAAFECEERAKNPPDFGGLIAWPKPPKGQKRTYRIFEATGWRERV